jgi:hypothetical protein
MKPELELYPTCEIQNFPPTYAIPQGISFAPKKRWGIQGVKVKVAAGFEGLKEKTLPIGFILTT